MCIRDSSSLAPAIRRNTKQLAKCKLALRLTTLFINADIATTDNPINVCTRHALQFAHQKVIDSLAYVLFGDPNMLYAAAASADRSVVRVSNNRPVTR